MALLSSAVVAGNHAYASEYNNLRTDLVNFTGTSTSMTQQAIINGNFDVWQRGTSIAVPQDAITFQADRWYDYASDDGGTAPTLTRSRQLLTSGDIPGAFYYSRLNTNGAGTSLGANSIHSYIQKIEHGTRYLCGENKQVTVSFYAKSDIANKKLGLYLIQGYGDGGSPTANESITGEAWTLTSSWVQYSYTFTTNTLSGKTFGTNNNDVLWVVFGNIWGTTSDANFGETTAETYVGSGNIDIAQVQLCSGDYAVPFQPKSYNQELADCLRYYYRINSNADGDTIAVGSNSATDTTAGIIFFSQLMRTAPTAGFGAASDFKSLSGGTNRTGTNLAVTSYTGQFFGARFVLTHGASATTGYASEFRFSAASKYLDFSAEL